MEQYLRDWRARCMDKHQYESAIFVGDKLWALTKKVEDAFWLAHVHFQTGNYSRAQSFLEQGDLIQNNPSCRYLSAHCSIKLGKTEEALQTLGDKNPAHLISAPGSIRQKLRHVELNSRTKHLKNGSRSDRIPTSEEREYADSNNLKFEAGMCYLRGVCYAKGNSFDRAKECYKVAVQIDVQCFEAFDQLMANALMSPEEEWKFLESLNFDTVNVDDNPSLSQEAAQFTKTLYTTRLSKYSQPDEFMAATESLSTHYNLAANADILLSKADFLFTQCRFRQALVLTTSIIDNDPYNFAALPIHLACLYEIGQKNTLYLLSHDLADTHPQEPCSWLAVGVYYLCTGKIAESRRFFSKASMMDPHFGPAWIGFAHTFAAEGEHDQAISAYSTAARLFQGTHLPQLFLGMQNLQLNHMPLAREYLDTAYGLCRTDPLVLNEMGVVHYHEDSLPAAINMFQRALAIAESNEADKDSWIPTRTNLAHALRRDGQLDDALTAFDEVLRLGHRDAAVFSAKALVLMEMGRNWDAVIALHEALAAAPQDPMATELLNRALEANETDSTIMSGGPGASMDSGRAYISDEEVDELDRKLGGRLIEIQQNRVAGRGGRRGRRYQSMIEEESGFGESMVVDSDD